MKIRADIKISSGSIALIGSNQRKERAYTIMKAVVSDVASKVLIRPESIKVIKYFN